jgi:D-alanyl-D-alanine dipeptidase
MREQMKTHRVAGHHRSFPSQKPTRALQYERMSKTLQYEDLIGIVVNESGETLNVVQETEPRVICRYEKTDMIPLLGQAFLLRAGTIERLVRAEADLETRDPNLRLRLAYAYRHPNVQRAYFEERKRQVAKRIPDISEAELIAKTHLLTASPDVAGHPTGGAIDVTISINGKDVDMGCGIADFSSEKIETYAAGLTNKQKQNRSLLREVLMNAGFAPFDGEWWHFSYGDREWAAYYRRPNAIYGQIALEYKNSHDVA